MKHRSLLATGILYDGGEENYIPWDTLADFFIKNL